MDRIRSIWIGFERRADSQIIENNKNQDPRWTGWEHFFCAQRRSATRLRYAPTCLAELILKHFPILRPLQIMISGLDRAKSAHCTMTVPVDSLLAGSISLARRLSFSRASRFICNFICEYFLKTCASP